MSPAIFLIRSSAGLVFLQYRSETKRALLPNEITSIDTVRALFVRSFSRQLTMAYLEGPNVKIYIHDASKDMFYELEDVRCVIFNRRLDVWAEIWKFTVFFVSYLFVKITSSRDSWSVGVASVWVKRSGTTAKFARRSRCATAIATVRRPLGTGSELLQRTRIRYRLSTSTHTQKQGEFGFSFLFYFSIY